MILGNCTYTNATGTEILNLECPSASYPQTESGSIFVAQI